MAIVTVLKTEYEMTSIDANDNQLTLVISVSRDAGFAPEVTEEQMMLSIYNQLQAGFPANAIQANRIRTVREDDLV